MQAKEIRLIVRQLEVKLRSRIKPVTDPANRDEMPRLLRIGLDLVPQVVHVRVDNAVCNEDVLSPDPFIELIDRHDLPAPRQQRA